MAAAAGSTTVHLISRDAELPDGSIVRLSLKAWLDGTGRITWELRRYLWALLGENYKTLDLSSWISRHKVGFAVVCNRLGMNYADTVIPSQLAMQRGSLQVADESLVKTEYSITTKGLLAMMVWLSVHPRSKENKNRASALLKAFLSAVLVTDCVSDVLEEIIQDSRPDHPQASYSVVGTLVEHPGHDRHLVYELRSPCICYSLSSSESRRTIFGYLWPLVLGYHLS
jgi:hypothetical protein